MKVTTVTLGRTFNLGNYESLRIEMSAEITTQDIIDTDDLSETTATQNVLSHLEARINLEARERGAKIK